MFTNIFIIYKKKLFQLLNLHEANKKHKKLIKIIIINKST